MGLLRLDSAMVPVAPPSRGGSNMLSVLATAVGATCRICSRSFWRFTTDWVTAARLRICSAVGVTHVGDEALDVADGTGDVGQHRIQIGSAPVDDAGQGGEPVLELHYLRLARLQCSDEGLQVGDDVGDAAAAGGQDPAHAGELGQRLAQLVAVTGHGVRGAGDEPGRRSVRHPRFRSEFDSQPVQLVLHLVPLHRDRRPAQRNRGAVGHHRPAGPVGRRQLHVTRRDQVLRDDDRLGIGGDRDRRSTVSVILVKVPPRGWTDSMVPTRTPPDT